MPAPYEAISILIQLLFALSSGTDLTLVEQWDPTAIPEIDAEVAICNVGAQSWRR